MTLKTQVHRKSQRDVVDQLAQQMLLQSELNIMRMKNEILERRMIERQLQEPVVEVATCEGMTISSLESSVGFI